MLRKGLLLGAIAIFAVTPFAIRAETNILPQGVNDGAHVAGIFSSFIAQRFGVSITEGESDKLIMSPEQVVWWRGVLQGGIDAPPYLWSTKVDMPVLLNMAPTPARFINPAISRGVRRQ